MYIKSYKSSHTEWAIFFLKFIEAVLSLICMMYHMAAIIYKEEPMPHNVLFCATFGGYFILGVSGMFAPFSGQLTPPGVDMMFGLIAFGLFAASAISAMYYVMHDPHLIDEEMTDEEEAKHPFFVHCRQHCVMSLITGTFYLMHAVISADRLRSVRIGLIEDEEEQVRAAGIPVIDISEETPLTLHLLLLDWILLVWNLDCTKACRQCCTKRFKRRRSTGPTKRKKHHPQPHLKAHIKELQRIKSQEFASVSSPNYKNITRSSDTPSKLESSSTILLIIEDEKSDRTPRRSLSSDLPKIKEQWPSGDSIQIDDDVNISQKGYCEPSVKEPLEIIRESQNILGKESSLHRRRITTKEDKEDDIDYCYEDDSDENSDQLSEIEFVVV